MKLWIDHCPSMMKWLFNTVHEMCEEKGMDQSVHQVIDNLEVFTRHIYYDRTTNDRESSVESHFDYDILKCISRLGSLSHLSHKLFSQ